MEQNLYIPGDLVMTNGVPLGTKEGIVYRVTACDPSKTLKLDDGTVLKGTVCLENVEGASIGDKGFLMGDCCAWVKDIVPIPLTPEILEKNGWEHENDVYFIHNPLKLVICEGIVSVFNDSCSIKLRPVKFVHELQHLLFGLGLDNRLEV